jgi:D-alanyl-D-alanine carboxypeptidase/D-alanyl-D-alanine-endopeptidase (penicillin-binding protein 4)
VTDSPDLPPTEALTRRSLRENGKAGSRSARKPGGQSKGGLQGLIAKHPTIWLASAIGVVFLLLGTAAVFAGVSAGSGSAAVPLASESAVPPRPQPSAFPSSSRLRTCSVAGVAANPSLAAFSGYVINANTGETLFDRNGTVPQRSGSIVKVLTAAAAVIVLGPNGQLSTRVIDGSTPGSIVLVGGGDPTLATTTNSYYEGAPQISDLAEAAMDRYESLHPGVPITSIVLDSTMWAPSDNWDPSWPTSERTEGYQSLVTALMVDGDRANPTQAVSPRGTQPVQDAGIAFAEAADLDLGDITFSTGSAIGSTVLAEVKSQPVSSLIGQMLQDSDNTLAEMLARVVSKAQGLDGSSGSLAQAIPGALANLSIPTNSTLGIRDGSGLSDLNAVSPQYVSQLMVQLRANAAGLGIVYGQMPVGGVSGDLADRFTGANAPASGHVIAKPGWLSSEYSLGGTVDAADGTPLAFAFYAIRDGITRDAREALDTMTMAIFSCGDNLSTN